MTSDRITSYIKWRQDEKAAAATINRELAALRRAFRLASERRQSRAAPGSLDASRKQPAQRIL